MQGVTNIIELINKKTGAEAEQIMAEAEQFKAKRLANAKERAKDLEDGIAGKAQREADSEIARYEASAKLKAKYRILESREALMKEVLDSAWEKIMKSVSDKPYDKTVTRLAVDGGVSLQESEIELVFPEGQKVNLDTTGIAGAVTKATGVKTKVSISKETVRATGGVVVKSKDGSKSVDNTFEARLERLDAKIRNLVSSTLFSATSSE
ncbi:MAG: V-type ATP synthase subunit E [Candidatus Thorarchaeota archaeon]|jgi:V/A-type H+-transporting ATPase subunit E